MMMLLPGNNPQIVREKAGQLRSRKGRNMIHSTLYMEKKGKKKKRLNMKTQIQSQLTQM